MKYLCYIIIIIFAVGCSTFSKKEDKAIKKIQATAVKIDKIKDDKLNYVAQYAYGVAYSLDKCQPSSEMAIAYKLNTRIQSIAGQPTVDQISEMELMIDNLISSNKLGEQILLKKDKEIADLQADYIKTISSKDKAIEEYITQAQERAAKADQAIEQYNEITAGSGLHAIAYGIKKLLRRILYLVIGIVLLYIIAKLLSTTSPIFASIFSIFEQIVAMIINMLKAIAPQATKFAKLVHIDIFNSYKQTLDKLVDSIQLLKEKNDKQYSLDELMEELDKNFDAADKRNIEECKKELRWK